MTNTIFITPEHLAAVDIAASCEETRYYLNGVCIEHYGKGGHGLIATDGHRLHSIGGLKDAEVKASLIVPSSAIKAILTVTKLFANELARPLRHTVRIKMSWCNDEAFKMQPVVVDEDKESGIEGAEFDFKFIDGTFPDWRRVVPSFDGEAVDKEQASWNFAVNGKYLSDFAKASKVLGNRTQVFKLEGSYSDHNPAIVSIPIKNHSDFMGVIMPMRY